MSEFQLLGLSSFWVRALVEQGYEQPTPIQSQAIPAVLSGKDILAAAQTGTVKTTSFVFPIFLRISQIDLSRSTQCALDKVLILKPTRELASQVEESIWCHGKYLDVKSMVKFEGVSIQPQIQWLSKRLDVLDAMPGRLLDQIGQKTIDLTGIEVLVLEEADCILDMSFFRDIRRILPLLPRQRQNLLFSATFSNEIKLLASAFLYEPINIEVEKPISANALVHQVIHPVNRIRKSELLVKLILDRQWQQVLVFTRTKHGANRFAVHPNSAVISAMAIHGNKSQGAREKSQTEFIKNQLQVLVATDIAARGIDIDSLPHVVNYELPNMAEDYVHRIGRTGRAGYSGHAILLVCVDELGLLVNIEKLLQQSLAKVVIDGFTTDPSIPPEPIRKTPQRAHQRPSSHQPHSLKCSTVGSTQPCASAVGGSQKKAAVTKLTLVNQGVVNQVRWDNQSTKNPHLTNGHKKFLQQVAIAS